MIPARRATSQGWRYLDRRSFLAAGAASVLAVACRSSSSDEPESAPSQPTPSDDSGEGSDAPSATPADADPVESAASILTSADFAALATCVALPETTTGPFPLDEQFVRRQIAEGQPGHPLRLGLRVVDGQCQPISGAAVEIWHTDATGDYSAFTDNGNGKDESEGTTFCRGTQTADADGIVEFHTIYPGWYPGRAVHIHLRVRTDDTTALVSQLYFPDDHTADVFAGEHYQDNGLPDTTNDNDGLAVDPETDGSMLTISTDTEGTLALANVGVPR